MKKVFINAIKRNADVKIIGCNIVDRETMPVYAVKIFSDNIFILTRYKKEILYKFISSYEYELLDSFSWDTIKFGRQMYLGFRVPFIYKMSVEEVEHLTVYQARSKGFLVTPETDEIREKLLNIEEDITKVLVKNLSSSKQENADIYDKGSIEANVFIKTLSDGVSAYGKLVGLKKSSKDLELGEYEECSIFFIRTREFGDMFIIDERVNNRILIRPSTIYSKGCGFYSTDILVECSKKFGDDTVGDNCVIFEKDPYSKPRRSLINTNEEDFSVYKKDTSEYMVYTTILNALYEELKKKFLLHQ